jgi:hypothetical protein
MVIEKIPRFQVIYKKGALMVSKPNMNPNDSPIQGPKPAHPTEPTSPKKGWNPKPLRWMGMTFDSEQTKQLWNTISQTIGQAIERDKARVVAALKKLRESTDLDSEGDS